MATDASRVEAIFFAVLDIGNPQERIAYLNMACGDDLELRRHIERLLDSHPKLGDFLDGQAADIVAIENHAITERPGTIIGRYKLLQRIGEGGFGVVFMAEQQEPVVRKVALKIIKPGMDTREVVARFEAERQALALMDHPNIARVFDAGATDSGRPYFVMELVKGVLITEYCDRNDLSAEERLKLFASICRAVQHAHQKGIIHRDIKPSNIMVTLHDGHPVPKIIDFGVSKAISQRLTEKTLFTAYGQMIGTPQYMSPEQAEMSGLDVDTRSDVYSLGVLLYELLTGTTPLEADRLRTAGYAEMQRIIREEDPPRPSVRLSTMGEQLTVVAKHRSVDGKRLQQLMRGELDWIVMKSMEKERVRRYESADSLATDVERFLTGEAVAAHPQSGAYQVRKFVRRHRAAVLTASAVLAALVLGIFGTTTGLVREALARSALARAYDELSRTQRATEAARGAANEAKSQLETHVSSLRMNAAFQAWEDGNSIRLEKLLRQNQPNSETSAVPSFESNFLLARHRDDQPTKTIPLDTAALRLAFSPDGTCLALGLLSGQVELYECASEKRIPLLAPDESTAADENVCAVCFSPDGRWLVAGRGVDSAGVTDAASSVGHLYLFELPSHKMTVLPWTHERAVRSLAISPDSNFVASLSLDGVTRVWSIPEGTLKWENRESYADIVGNLAFSPDADCRVLAIVDEKGVGLWDIDTGQLRDRQNTDTRVHALAFSYDGRHLATSDSTGIRMWNMQSAKLSDGVRVSTERNLHLAFLPGNESDVLAAVGIDNRMVKLWDVRRGRQTRRLVQRGWPHAIVISPDGNWLASSSDTVRLWNLKDDEKNLCVAQPTNWPALALSPDNQTAAAAGADGKVQLWNTLTGIKSVLSGHEKTVNAVAFSQTSGKLASADTVTVRVWDLLSQNLLATYDKSGMYSVALSPNGQRLAAGTTGGITIWNLDTGESQDLTAKGSVQSLVFTSDGRYLASSGQEETVVWNVEGNIPLRATEWPEWGGLVRSLAFSPDGTLLAVPEVEAVGLWDWLGQKQQQLSVGSTFPGAAAFSPDGATVVATSPTGEVKFWKVSTGEEVGTFRIEGVRNVAIFADGHAMVTASMDGTLRVWRTSPQEKTQ